MENLNEYRTLTLIINGSGIDSIVNTGIGYETTKELLK
jgi:hypothetical protein